MKLTKAFFNEIRELIQTVRTSIARGIDLIQVRTNFEIGRRIVEQEQKGKGRAAYGELVIKTLAERLTHEFGKGFSRRNLELIRRFFLTYSTRSDKIAQTLSALSSRRANAQTAPAQFVPIEEREAGSGRTRDLQSTNAKTELPGLLNVEMAEHSTASLRPFTVSWSHYVLLLGIKNNDERSFYEIESNEQNWTVRELKRQYNSSLYERLALSRDKAGIRKLAKQGQQITKPEDLLKEPLVLEFLGLEEQYRYSESDLETAIINQIERFLLELGKGFLFEARQRRFTFDGDHYWVDLVFYNRLLRCYVLIDLKLGKLTHQDLGQMQMYVNYFDEHEKMPDEAATVGIILCKQESKAMVRMTLPKGANIHAREYQLYLPSKQELRRKLVEWADKCDG